MSRVGHLSKGLLLCRAILRRPYGRPVPERLFDRSREAGFAIPLSAAFARAAMVVMNSRTVSRLTRSVMVEAGFMAHLLDRHAMAGVAGPRLRRRRR